MSNRLKLKRKLRYIFNFLFNNIKQVYILVKYIYIFLFKNINKQYKI